MVDATNNTNNAVINRRAALGLAAAASASAAAHGVPQKGTSTGRTNDRRLPDLLTKL
jgi:hypothetical protein